MGYRDGGGIFFIGRGEADASRVAATCGRKAGGLARLDQFGFAVPPALAISSEVCREYFERGTFSGRTRQQLETALHHLEEATGLALAPAGSLVLAVRPSPSFTTPGMLETITNVGLSEANIHALIRRTGDPWLAWDAYRRLVRAFADARCAPRKPFELLEAEYLARAQASGLEELDVIALRDLARKLETRLQKLTGYRIPSDPFDQIVSAIELVLASWHAPRARECRRLNGVEGNGGMAVLLQTMVFGSGAGRSGSGVVFTRNPATGADELYVDFIFNAHGDDLASGRTRVTASSLLPAVLPDAWRELETAKRRLERELGDMLEIAFTVEDGRLYFLQVRPGQRTPWAALHITADLVDAAIVDPATALGRLAQYDIPRVNRTQVTLEVGEEPLGRGIPAAPGVATGSVVFDAERARRFGTTRDVILVRPDFHIDDLAALAAAAGAVSACGARTSHAAVAARHLGKAYLVGCTSLRIDETKRSCVWGSRVLREGDTITIDGGEGVAYPGELAVVTQWPSDVIWRIERWRDAATPSRVRSEAQVAG